MMSLTVDEILRGTGPGPAQSVGQMSVIPLLGEDDDTFAAPVVLAGTTGYGSVHLRNDTDRPMLVPPGVGWMVTQKAQNHAIGGGALLRPGESRQIDTAMCIQQSQGGLIAQGKHDLIFLPAALRAKALSVRHVRDFRKLWESIQGFNASFGIDQHGGHLEFFVRAFQKELDEFVAEFEVVPRQVGPSSSSAARSPAWSAPPRPPSGRRCGGRSSGCATAPWRSRSPGRTRHLPATRSALHVETRSLAGLRDALARARDAERAALDARLRALRVTRLSAADQADETLAAAETLDALTLTTIGSPRLSGQVVTQDQAVRFASLCAAA